MMKLSKDFKLNEVSGDFMLIRTKGNRTDMRKVFCLNEPAAFLYRKLGSDPFDESVMIACLTEEYDVDEATARKDISAMLAFWKQYGIVEDDK